ncbi:hypothetical protein V8G54_028953 [Vigna mungo]|uniref:Transmembrane protein n=1 Tax=Vigna mungo TaxID=3915 RepID=A0AAQ3MT81_VIGMU
MVMSTLSLSCEFSFRVPTLSPPLSNNSLKPLSNPFIPYKLSQSFLLSSNTFNNMEIKSTLTNCFLLFFLILAISAFSRVIGESEALHSEIYEIDYRGPETHSSIIPPPHHFHIRKPHSSTPQKGSHTGTKALRDYSYPENKASLLYCLCKRKSFTFLPPC